MPINPDAVGTTSEPFATSWTSKDALLYAVGIGAGGDELAFTTENTADVDQQVFPTFAVVIPAGGGVHARHRHLQPGDARPRRAAGDAAQADPARRLGHRDEPDRRHLRQGQGGGGGHRDQRPSIPAGEPLYTTYMSAFIRGEGGWGGDRGPGGARNEPPERAADHTVTYQTSPDQAFVYRLSGDRNPLHTDPKFAAMGGFDRPILHGLCSLRVHRPGPAAHAGRQRPGPVPPHRGPVLLAGAAGRRPHHLDVAHGRRRGRVPDGQGRRHRRDRPGSRALQLKSAEICWRFRVIGPGEVARLVASGIRTVGARRA